MSSTEQLPSTYYSYDQNSSYTTIYRNKYVYPGLLLYYYPSTSSVHVCRFISLSLIIIPRCGLSTQQQYNEQYTTYTSTQQYNEHYTAYTNIYTRLVSYLKVTLPALPCSLCGVTRLNLARLNGVVYYSSISSHSVIALVVYGEALVVRTRRRVTTALAP